MVDVLDRRHWRFGVGGGREGGGGGGGVRGGGGGGVDGGVDVRGGEKGWLREARVVGANGVGLGRRVRRERDERRNRRGGASVAVEGLGEGKREAKSWWCGCGWKCAVGSGSFCVSRNTKRV